METDSLSDKDTFLRSLINDFPELGICVFFKKKKKKFWKWTRTLDQGILKGVGISFMTTDNLQNRPIQTSQTGGRWYGDTSPL